MKRAIFILLIVSNTIIIKSQTSRDTIKWTDFWKDKLKIEDFKGVPDSNAKFKAISFISEPYRSYVKRDTLDIRIQNLFISKESWFKREQVQKEHLNTLLKHEQGHFDIAEIEVRKTRKRFYDNKASITKSNFKQVILQYMAEQTANIKERHKLYDQETNFSIDEKKQKEWDDKIAKELKELHLYWGEWLGIALKK